jgi:hypothetical protein
MLIDIRDIRRRTYVPIRDDERIKSHSSDKITTEELRDIAGRILVSLSSVIFGFSYIKDAAHCQLLANGLRRGLEENYQNNLHDEKSGMYYENLNAFLTGNLEIVNSESVRLKKPITEEQVPIVAKMAKECITLCLDEFDKDIKAYADKKRIKWVDKVERVKVVEKVEGSGIFTIKRMGDEDLRDNEGKSEAWKDRIKKARKSASDKENKVNL